jgi:hypothetical protein
VEAKGTGGQKSRLSSTIGPDQHFKRTAFDLFGLAGINKMARRKDEGTRGKDFGLPAVRKAEIHNRRRNRRGTFAENLHGFAL